MISRRSLLTLPLGLAAAGCSSFSHLGASSEPPLPGKRIPVMLLDTGPKVDPAIAATKVVLPAPVRNPAWPQVEGNAQHTMGHLEASTVIKKAWTVSIGAGSSSDERILSTPVIAGGNVYTVDSEGGVRCFAAKDGSRLWSVKPETGQRSDRLTGGAAAFGMDRLFMTRSHGDVFALDPAKGQTIWRQKIRAPIRSAPTIEAGKLLIRTDDNQMFALDAATGAILWNHSGLFQQAGILGSAPPAALGEVAVVAYSSGEVFALLLDSGRAIWSVTVTRARRTLAIDTITDITGAPVIDHDRVLVAGNGGEMAAIDLRRGNRIWDLELTSLQTPWVAGDFIYIVTDRGEIVCLMRDGGQIRWVSPLARAESKNSDTPPPVWAGPLLVSDRLLVVGSNGDVVSVSPYTGEILGRVADGGGFSLAPVAADGTVYALSNSGYLVAYR